MTPYCSNIISNTGTKIVKISLGKVRIFAIYKYAIYNMQVKYSIFLVSLSAMTSTEERTIAASLCVAVAKFI